MDKDLISALLFPSLVSSFSQYNIPIKKEPKDTELNTEKELDKDGNEEDNTTK